MTKGVVKFFNQAKGFGFIKTETGNEVFVHVSGVVNEINENDEVEFEIEEGRRGPTAVKVKLA
ncbi:MAG: cold shock domain-containing protein [Bacteroidota bacterium]